MQSVICNCKTHFKCQVKSSHLYLYSAFNNTNCNKALHNIKIGKFCQCKMTGFNTQLSAECISLLNLVMALSSLNNICAIKSMIVLQVKCPQLSKPEATAARNENSIGDRMEKKPWEKPGSVGGASSPPARRISSLFQLQQSQCKWSTGSRGLSPMDV